MRVPFPHAGRKGALSCAHRYPQSRPVAGRPRIEQKERLQMRLADCHSFHDFRKLAMRRLPGPIFNYIDGAADDEVT